MVTFTEINGAFPQYYQILGVATNATRRDISQAYKPLALAEHPDKNGSTPEANERFANINQAR
jgi:DnaJ-class molecular chaperone